MKEYFTLPGSPEVKPHRQIQLHIQDTFGVLSFCRARHSQHILIPTYKVDAVWNELFYIIQSKMQHGKITDFRSIAMLEQDSD